MPLREAASLDFTKEDWLKERIRDRAARADGFKDFETEHPLQARIWLAFCNHADAAFEAMFTRWDVDAFSRAASAMAELATWISDDRLATVQSADEVFQKHVRDGVPVGHAIEIAEKPQKKKHGRPISNRWPVMLALEHWRKVRERGNRDLSYMQLAVLFCRCGKPNHDERCRDRLRKQMIVLERKLTALGVEKNPNVFLPGEN